MIINKAYLLTDKKNFSSVEEMVRLTFNEVEVYNENNYMTITTINEDAFQLKLFKLYRLAMTDMNIKLYVLIVPFYDNMFLKYFNYFNGGVTTTYEVFVRNLDKKEVISDCKEILSSINKKDIDTIKAFLMCNGNSCVTASELYLHRNSFNYRMNSFISSTSMDIRDINTIMFLKLILCIN